MSTQADLDREAELRGWIVGKEALIRNDISDIGLLLMLLDESRADLARWEELRVACAQILEYDTDWPRHGNAPLAIAAALQLRVNDRPEGAVAPPKTRRPR